MNGLTKENKLLLSRLMGAIGAAFSVFIPFFGFVFFCIGIGCSYKRETNELKHSLCFNIVGLVCALLVVILTLVQLY